MKKLLSILFIFSITTVFTSCDDIEEPYLSDQIIEIPTLEEQFPDPYTQQKVLILDFTAHKCPNCPSAHRSLELIESTYPDRINSVAVHGGSLSDFNPNAAEFFYDFTTETGDQIFSDFTIWSQPKGVINEFSGDNLLSHSVWKDSTDSEILKTPDAGLSIIVVLDSAETMIEVHNEISFFNDIQGDIKITVYLTESNIITWQIDNEADPEEVEDYEHNHVLRMAIPSTYGVNISDSTDYYTANTQVYKSFSASLNPEWNLENCHAVAFIYDDATKRVIQSETIHVIE